MKYHAVKKAILPAFDICVMTGCLYEMVLCAKKSFLNDF